MLLLGLHAIDMILIFFLFRCDWLTGVLVCKLALCASRRLGNQASMIFLLEVKGTRMEHGLRGHLMIHQITHDEHMQLATCISMCKKCFLDLPVVRLLQRNSAV